ncbi:sensor histidine kinase [Dyadobacter sp. CY326]|uniref:sensor histidine kinase n=1 Tax=Dyadobacter sp. CY326 TaxID=2907300 RepID=UPI001F45B667|nr:ATP-binding protein [Dyadobacter sp. CY326]MCE7066659.1 ATP-binding protein [Dyadobacter sp. CY326]
MQTYPEEVLFSIVLGTALLLFFVAIFVFVILQFQKKQFRNRLEQSQMQKDYDQAILHVQIEVQNRTMQRISEELHDNIGQLLSVARIHLNSVEEGNPNEDNIGSVREANGLIERSLSDLRAISKSLDSDFLKDFGLAESIAQELGRIRNTRIFNTVLKTDGEPYSLGAQQDIVVFRVVQEVLQNCIKHSHAKELSVKLAFREEEFELSVIDDGDGFNIHQLSEYSLTQSGSGLRNIHRRAALLGGHCTLNSAAGKGTSVVILIPRRK